MSVSVFTKIIRRQLPAEILYENDRYIVILSIEPHNPGHSLVIPKDPGTGKYWEMPPDEFSELLLLAQQVSQAIIECFAPARVALLFEGFGVQDHNHVNLIPINRPADVDHDHAKVVTADQLKQAGKQLRPVIAAKLDRP